MSYVVEYFHVRIKKEIENWPVGKDRRVIILHAFIKKTRATPVRELATARRRLKEVKDA